MSDSKVRGCDGDCMLLYKQCAVCQRDHDDLFNGRKAEYERLNPPEPPTVPDSTMKCCSFRSFEDKARFIRSGGTLCVICRAMVKNPFAIPEPPMVTDSPLKDQVGGNHYSKLAIQPVEYIHKNKIPFIEGSVIKYVTRWRDKGGIKDLQKAKHFIELLIELENDNVGKAD